MPTRTNRCSRGCPTIVDHVDRYRDHWADQDAHITETEAAIADGTITIDERPDLDLAIVTVPDVLAGSGGPAVHDGRVERRAPVRAAQRHRPVRDPHVQRWRAPAPVPVRDVGALRVPSAAATGRPHRTRGRADRRGHRLRRVDLRRRRRPQPAAPSRRRAGHHRSPRRGSPNSSSPSWPRPARPGAPTPTDPDPV